MKRVIILAITLCLIFCVSACTTKTPPPYTNTPITDTYIFQDTPALTLTASYPYFEEENYAPLNAAIAQEVEAWRAIYTEILAQVQEECEQDPVFAKLKQYVEANYTIEATDKEVSVTFDVKYYSGGNTEPSYAKTFTFDTESRMVYETFTQTQRVY